MTPPIVVWTARLSAGCWLARWIVQPVLSRGAPPAVIAVLWTSGAVLNLLHVATVFALVHGWSHTAAAEAIARETLETTGIDWSGGIWCNYAFTAAWVLDAARLWWERRLGRRVAPFWLVAVVQSLLAVIVFNATVVFGPRGWAVVFSAAAGAAIVRLMRRRGHSRRGVRSSSLAKRQSCDSDRAF